MRRQQGVHQTSPERTRACAAETPIKPPSKQHQQGRKVSVVYYLCNNRHLEHPHFIEVPLSFPEGLYLKDVINRLNVLRGRGMAAMYSWSCKRGYKNGFVWHDIGEDDLILPAHGSEYVLKGSELLDQSPPPDRNHNAMIDLRNQNTREPRHESSPVGVHFPLFPPSPPLPPPPALPPPPPSQPDEILPFANRSSSFERLSAEPGCRSSPPSAVGSPAVVDFRLKDPITMQNASTQTDGQRRRRKNEAVLRPKEAAEIEEEERSQKPISSSYTCSSPCGKTSTLESLIRDEHSHRNNFRIVEEEEVFSPTRAKLKATDVLVQLITCGSISVKDHYSFGIVPTYKPRFLKSSPSPMFSGSIIMPADEIECSSKSRRVVGFRIEEESTNNLGGSVVEIMEMERGN